MRFSILFMFALTVTTAMPAAHAAEETQPVSPQTNVMAPSPSLSAPQPAPQNFKRNSEANREGKEYMAVGQPIGVGPTLTLTQGLMVGYYIDRNTIVTLEGTWTPIVDSGSDMDSTRTSADSNSFGVHYKRFVANSLYIKGGLDYRRMKYAYKYGDWFDSQYDYSYEFQGNSSALSIVIGNQWQFGSFTIGCDWIGGVLPLTSSFSGSKTSGDLTNYDKSRLEDAKKQYVSAATVEGLRLYLGASW